MTKHSYNALWRGNGFRLFSPDDDGQYRLEIAATDDGPARAVWLTRVELRQFLITVIDELTAS